jgi:hypothetical protein
MDQLTYVVATYLMKATDPKVTICIDSNLRIDYLTCIV